MIWPGLTTPIIQHKEIVRQKLLPPDKEREQRLIDVRTHQGKVRSNKQHILERGWAGKRLPGKSIGKPDQVGDGKFQIIVIFLSLILFIIFRNI